MKVTRYSYLLTFNDRKRHEHHIEHGAVKRFTVQYETFIDGNWYPVIRYDTAHGFPHMDRIHPDGTLEKIPLYIKDLGETVTFFDQDIDENWVRYKEAYRKRKSA